MKSRFLPKLNYSNVIATMALFIALGGIAVAAGLPKNSVGTKQLKRGAVTTSDLRRNAVRAGKLAPKSVVVGKLGPSAVLPGNIGNGAITSAKIGNGAVIARSIKNSVVTTNKLNNDAVTSAKLDNESVTAAKLGKGSVTLSKLSDEIAPLLGTLRSGQTLRGVFDLGDESKLTRAGISFQFPLLNTPAANILLLGATSTACSGLGGGGVTPQAAGGQLCIYITAATPEAELAVDAGTVNRLGFGLLAKFKAPGDNLVQGQWAVTAP